MTKQVLIALQVFMVVLGSGAGAAASNHPIGRCPDSFELHPAISHDDHHGHHHIGSHTDRNGDGWICVKHVGVDQNNHVHIDNNATLQ